MACTKKTRPGTAIPGRVVETGIAFKQTTTSTTHDTTSPPNCQTFRVADLLHPGAKNAIPRRDLMALTGCTDRERFVKSMRHRSAEIARVADAVEQAEV